jgi:hypothetical protein
MRSRPDRKGGEIADGSPSVASALSAVIVLALLIDRDAKPRARRSGC